MNPKALRDNWRVLGNPPRAINMNHVVACYFADRRYRKAPGEFEERPRFVLQFEEVHDGEGTYSPQEQFEPNEPGVMHLCSEIGLPHNWDFLESAQESTDSAEQENKGERNE